MKFCITECCIKKKCIFAFVKEDDYEHRNDRDHPRVFKTQPVLKAWIFGSYARGEETENSDVDILVSFDQ